MVFSNKLADNQPMARPAVLADDDLPPPLDELVHQKVSRY